MDTIKRKYNYSSKLPQEEVETYTTWWEVLKEFLIMLPVAILFGLIAMAVVLI